MCNSKEQNFIGSLLDTNRGYNYYVDWENAKDYEKYIIELSALDCLIRIEQDKFKDMFVELLKKVPTVILTFPYLFALSKAERVSLNRSNANQLKLVGTELDSEDFQEYSFSVEDTKNMTISKINEYYNFFVQMGLENLFVNMLNKSTIDYVIGVLVGLDSNGRKNRGGEAFELACEPLIKKITQKYNLELICQKKFSILSEHINISEDIANRKADFIIHNKDFSKVLNIEVNFFNGTGSKPEEIIDSYINRQNDLKANNIRFALITDGSCWKQAKNQLSKGFRHLDCLSNYKTLKNGTIEKLIKDIFC